MALFSYSTKEECQFVHNVKDELDMYQNGSDRTRVLLFPPLPSRLRYLIHRTIEDLPELASFSIGESWCRRVVACFSELRAYVEEDSDLGGNTCETESDRKSQPSVTARSRGPKRPDKPLYMPRAVRQRLSLQNSQAALGDQELPSVSPSSSSCISTSMESCSSPETTENSRSSSSSRQEIFPGAVGSVLNHTADSSELCPQVLTLQEDEHQLWEHPVSGIDKMSLEDDEKDTEDLDSLIKVHLKEAVTFSIHNAQNDYSVYENVSLNPDEFRHVIEIYNFPAMLKTDDLLDAFSACSDGGMKIKWIDNTHALGVFSSESAAHDALSICHPLLKVRPLAEGSKKAKGKAFRHAEFIQPVKDRPRTDCAVAQRMVTRALGLQRRGRVKRY